jgi:hypothetical protein
MSPSDQPAGTSCPGSSSFSKWSACRRTGSQTTSPPPSWLEETYGSWEAWPWSSTGRRLTGAALEFSRHLDVEEADLLTERVDLYFPRFGFRPARPAPAP